MVDNLVGSVGRSAWRDDDMAADAGVGALRRRAARLVAHHPGCPTLLEIAAEMNRIDDGVHIAVPFCRRERDMSLSH